MGAYRDDGTGGITGRIIGAAIAVHRHLGPGLLESAYEVCLAHDLRLEGLAVERQVAVPLVYRGLRLERAYRMDLLVERKVVVEVKAVSRFEPVHVSQVLSYLRLARLRVGLLLNFNVNALGAGGIKRLLNARLSSEASAPPSPPSPPPPPLQDGRVV